MIKKVVSRQFDSLNSNRNFMKNLTILVAALLFNVVLKSNAVAQTTPIRVVTVGNSITAGDGTTNKATKAYPIQLGKLLGSNYLVYNCGVGGRTMLKNGDGPYWNTPEFLTAKNLDAQILIISLGTNDSRANTNWTYHKKEYYPDYTAMVHEFRKASKDSTKLHIFVCFPPPAFLFNYGIVDKTIRTEILPLIDSVKNTSGTSKIDFYHQLLPYGNLFPDGIHPNDKGAAVMAQIAYNAIMQPLDLTSVQTPASNNSLTSSEPIKITINNNHEKYLVHVPVAYTINDGPLVRDTIDKIPAYREINFTFSRKADLSEYKEYSIAVYTCVDTLKNDTVLVKVTNFKPNADLSLNFFGNNNVVNVAHSESMMPSAALSVEAMVYPTTFRLNYASGTVVSKEQTVPNRGYALSIGGNGQGRFAIYDGAIKEAVAPVGTFSLNKWYNIVGVYNGSSVKLYVDGVLKATTSAGIISASTGKFRIGQTAASDLLDRAFIGRIDEVSIWNKELTETEIVQSQGAQFVGDEAGLVAYYKFDDGPNAFSIKDNSGMHNGIVQNIDLRSCWMMGAGLLANKGVSIPEIPKIPGVLIVPNPTSDFIVLKWSTNTIQRKIVLTDIFGKEVYSSDLKDENELIIDMQKFAKGLYLLTLKSATENTTMKVILK